MIAMELRHEVLEVSHTYSGTCFTEGIYFPLEYGLYLPRLLFNAVQLEDRDQRSNDGILDLDPEAVVASFKFEFKHSTLEYPSLDNGFGFMSLSQVR